MQQHFDQDPSADPIEPADLPVADTDTPAPAGDPVGDDLADIAPADPAMADQPGETAAPSPGPSVTPAMTPPMAPDADDAGAAQRRIRMQLYSRMMTDLQVLTGDKRMATDAEIDEALTRAARALGVWRPAAQDAVWQKPASDPLNGDMAPPRLHDAAIFTREDPRSVSTPSGLDAGASAGQARFDTGFGNPPPVYALDSGAERQPPETAQRGNAGGIYGRSAKPAKDYNKIRLGPKDMAYQRNLIPFDNDIIENTLLPSGRRKKELEKLITQGKADDIISRYFQIEYSRDFTSNNPLRAEAHRNLIASLRLLVGTGVGQRLLLNMAYKGARQKVVLSPVGETQAVSGEGSAILFNFRQVGEVEDLPKDIPQTYRLAIAVAHELGHSILGYSDPAKMRGANWPAMSEFVKMSKPEQKTIIDTMLPNTMGDSVKYVENALRAELNVIPRKSYLLERHWRPFYDVYEKNK
ncbi:hypothetical protein [Sphingomonas alpina]|uniref:Uncharacterized protein n=1 Tax=Sphingomonas alpina TaxID=653931 RepID=A0A7H0LES1_9SPHN|nr:hypothetical protein [Sphingomonas alpina]QNQ08174.1 hypothetical protein H3Z74_15550 [Sphingomonas alpina]